MSIKIAISNTKGGIGKSSTAICLATGLVKKGYKVLLIDADPNSISSTGVYKAQTEDEYTLTDVLYSDIDMSLCIKKTKLGDIIPCDKQLKKADTFIPSDTERFYHLIDASTKIDEMYDYIIVDCPPGEGVILDNILTFVNFIIIPITCDLFGIECLTDFEQIVNAHKKRINPTLSVLGVLITMYEGSQNITKGLEENIIPSEVKNLNTTLFNSKIRRGCRLKESQLAGISLYDYDLKSNVAIDYLSFVEEVIERTKGEK